MTPSCKWPIGMKTERKRELNYLYCQTVDHRVYLLRKPKTTFKTGVVVAVITRHIIPSVIMSKTKSVDAIFVFPVVWLLWGPMLEIAYFFVCPRKSTFYTSVIKSNPRPFAIVTMLNIDIFFLVVNCNQIGTHCSTVRISVEPRGTSSTCEVTVPTKIAPYSWLANICDISTKRQWNSGINNFNFAKLS